MFALLNSWTFWIVVIVVGFIIIWLIQHEIIAFPFIQKYFSKNSSDCSAPEGAPESHRRNYRSPRFGVPSSERVERQISESHKTPDITPVLDFNEYSDDDDYLFFEDFTPKIPEAVLEDNKEQKSSKGELECRRVMEEIYGVKFPNVRPDWLINDRTGYRMELDCYNADLKLAVEYNGEQHYKANHPFNRTVEQFKQQFYRDERKVDMCDEHGVYLITVPYNVPIKKIKDYILYYLPKSVLAREARKAQLDDI